MQPHSMCTLALVNYIWNSYRTDVPIRATARVEYQNRYGRYVSNIYRLFDIQISDDNRHLSVSTIRDGGGLSCTMDARRPSASEGSRVTMTHRTQHRAGLREEFSLYRTGIRNGKHFNSEVYGDFSGSVNPSNVEHIRLQCHLKNKFGQYVPVNYDLSLEVTQSKQPASEDKKTEDQTNQSAAVTGQARQTDLKQSAQISDLKAKDPDQGELIISESKASNPFLGMFILLGLGLLVIIILSLLLWL